MRSITALYFLSLALSSVQAGDPISARYGHSLTPLTQDDSSFLLFGGMATNASQATVPFPAYTFDNRQLQFTKLEDANSQPALIQDAGHLAELVHADASGPVVLYLSGLLYTYSPNGVWTQFSAPGNSPAIRLGAVGTTNGAGLLYMLGNGAASDSLWALDYDNKRWMSIALPDGLSGAITGHSMAFANNQLFVLGGMINGVYNTKLFAFDTSSGTWTAPIELGADAARTRFTMTAVDNKSLVIIGGQTAASPDGSGDAFVYSLGSQQLTKIAVTNDAMMTPRYGHSAYWDPIRSVVSVWGGSSSINGVVSDDAQIKALSMPIGLAGLSANNGHFVWYTLGVCPKGDCSGDYLVPGQTSPAQAARRQLALLIVLIILAVLFVAFIIFIILAKRGVIRQPAWMNIKMPKAGPIFTKSSKKDATIKSEDAGAVADAAAARRALPSVPAQSAVMSDTSSHHSAFDMTMLQSPAALDEYDEVALDDMKVKDVNTSFRTLAEVAEPEERVLKRTISTESRASSVSIESVQDYGESNQNSIHSRSRALSALGPFRAIAARRDSISSQKDVEVKVADQLEEAPVKSPAPVDIDETIRPESATESVITVVHEESLPAVDDEHKSVIESTMLDDLLRDLSRDVAVQENEQTDVLTNEQLDEFLQRFDGEQEKDAGIYQSTSTMATMLTVPDLHQASEEHIEEREDDEEGEIDWNVVPAIKTDSLALPPTHLPLPPSPMESTHSDYSNTTSLVPSEASDIKWTRVDGSIDPPRPEDAFRNLMAQLEAKSRFSGSD